jgi:CarD family transcriptional regulator
MAQKKKAPAKARAKSKPKSRPAAAAKPAKKSEARPAPKKVQPKAKSAPKIAVKAKAPVKPAAAAAKNAKPAPAPAKKPTVAVVPPKAPVKPAVAAKPAVAQVAAAPKTPSAPVKPAPAKPAATPPMARPAQTGAAGKPSAPVFRPGPVQFGTSTTAARTVPSALPKPAIRTFQPMPGTSGAAPALPRDIAQKAVDARQQQVAGAMANVAKKPVTARHGFKINESVVYPAHGVGRIIGIEEQEIAGMPLELFVIQFEKDKMTLKVPTGKLQTVGMRKLAEDDIVSKAMETLKGRARVKRTMWSRRAQEYEAKINSGDLVSIAEVVRDLYRSESQPEQSYSERQLYEAALDRMAREIAAVARIDERGAVQRITEVLAKSAKGRRAAEASEPADAEGDLDADAKAA